MAARPLKILALVAVGVLLLGGGALWYLFSQATALPEWYTEQDPGVGEADDSAPLEWVAITGGQEPWPHIESEPATAPHPSVGPPEPASPPTSKKRTRKAKRHVMRGFHRRGRKHSDKSAVKASRAVLEDGKLEAGVILDLSRVPKDKLTPRDRDLYDKAVRGFPGITRRDVYVGIEDRPVSRDGVLQLGSSPKVRVGNLRYSLDKAATKLGMSPAQLRAEFDKELRRMGMTDPNGR